MTYKNNIEKAGFTLIEMVVVVAIFTSLYLLEQNIALRPQQTTTIYTSVDTLIADVANQLNRSMTGDVSSGTVNTSYGVYFQSDSYTLFRGSAYSPSGPENIVVPLGSAIRFSTIDLPSSQIVFATSSGSIVSYDQAHNTVRMTDTVNNVTKTVRFNFYGVIDSIQ